MSRKKLTPRRRRRAKTHEEVFADVPTIIPKPKQPAAQFRVDMLLVDVIRICENDPGCGFRLRGSPRDEFYFLDAQWRERDSADAFSHAPMVANGDLCSWSTVLSFWAATLPTWRLVDLTKHSKFLQRIKREYVGQEITERHYVSFLDRRDAAKGE